MMFRYWSGLYRKQDQANSALVVSNGVGNGPRYESERRRHSDDHVAEGREMSY
ncbi:MAG: hypothetical protein ACJ8C4_14085 [Gemmataceae bacterium]